jgi:hypothetical protein
MMCDTCGHMDYHLGGVIDMRGVHDQEGTPCGRSADTLCYDCGTSLCSPHAKRCQFCCETFCQSCLTFHRNEHAKSAQSEQSTESPQEENGVEYS